LQQANGFHTNRFTARIWAGYHDNARTFIYLHIKRHHRFLFGFLKFRNNSGWRALNSLSLGLVNYLRHFGLNINSKQGLGAHKIKLG
jgi:hypothetical protein